MSLEELGWDSGFSAIFEALTAPGLEPGRVVATEGPAVRVAMAAGERLAVLAGRLRPAARGARGEIPTVGDWIAVRATGDGPARVEHLLPRRTKLSRVVAGRRSDEQVVAANVDLVLAVMGLDSDFNPRRLERILASAWDSGATPVVVLSKLDLCAEPAARREAVQSVAPGVRVLVTSGVTGDAIDDLRACIAPRETAVLVGSSGVGKSTLINRMLGAEVQPTAPVRASDERGRHTTTRRELFRLPGGGLLIDSPGIRELQLWAADAGVDQAFADVAELATACRYRDCAHESEPGCAVRESLDPERLRSYRALRKEARYAELRSNEGAQRAERARWKAIHRALRRK